MDVDEEPADLLDTDDDSSVPSWINVENHLIPVDATHIEIPVFGETPYLASIVSHFDE